MKKLLLIGLLLLFSLGLLSVSAAPVDQLTALAEYYPADTLMYGAIRTDDGLFEVVEQLLDRIETVRPGTLPPNITVRQLLNFSLLQITGDTFERSVRSWLGDSAAFGLGTFNLNSSDIPPLLIALEITNKDNALTFLLEAVVPTINRVERSTEGEFSIFSAPDLVIAVSNEALFIAPSMRDIPLSGRGESLSTVPAFNDTLARLPGDDYNALMYVDAGALNQMQMDIFRQTAPAQMSGLLQTILSVQSTTAIAFTVRDGDSLTIDAAQISDTNALIGDLNIQPVFPDPVDLDFAARIPADAPLVAHASDFGPAMIGAFESIRALDDFAAANGGYRNLLGLPPGDGREILDFLRLNDFVVLFNVMFAGVTGQNLERDVLPWMDGDFAFFLRFGVDRRRPFIAPDGALVIESSDAAASESLVRDFGEALRTYGIAGRVDEGRQGPVLLLPWLRSIGQPLDHQDFDLLLTAADSVLSFGTSRAVESVLEGENPLSEDPAFQAAAAHFLPDSQQVWFLNIGRFIDLIDQWLEARGSELRPFEINDLLSAREILAFVESGSITMVAHEDGASVSRFVLTLADAPLDPAPVQRAEPIRPTAAPLPTLVPSPTDEPAQQSQQSAPAQATPTSTPTATP